jgi:hypothetical protein
MDQLSSQIRSLLGGLSLDVCSLMADATGTPSDATGTPPSLFTNSSGDTGLSNSLSQLTGIFKGSSNSSTGAVSKPTSNSLKDKYVQYLPTAQKMFDSFQIMSNITNNSHTESSPKDPNQCQGLLTKLNTRLVNGEITTQQYDTIKKKIEC